MRRRDVQCPDRQYCNRSLSVVRRRLLRCFHSADRQHMHRCVSSWQVLDRWRNLMHVLCCRQVVQQGRRILCRVLHHMSRGQVRHGRLVVRILHRRLSYGQVQHNGWPIDQLVLLSMYRRFV